MDAEDFQCQERTKLMSPLVYASKNLVSEGSSLSFSSQRGSDGSSLSTALPPVYSSFRLNLSPDHIAGFPTDYSWWLATFPNTCFPSLARYPPTELTLCSAARGHIL